MDDVFAPPADLAASANVGAAEYARAAADPEAWWLEQAGRLTWTTAPTRGYDGADFPFVRWFADGRLNVAVNCVDRHVEAGNGDRVAIHWEGEPVGDSRSLSYAETHVVMLCFSVSTTHPRAAFVPCR